MAMATLAETRVTHPDADVLGAFFAIEQRVARIAAEFAGPET